MEGNRKLFFLILLYFVSAILGFNSIMVLGDMLTKEYSYFSLTVVMMLHIGLTLKYKIFYDPFLFSIFCFLLYMFIGNGNYLNRTEVDQWSDYYTLVFYFFIMLSFFLSDIVLKRKVVKLFISFSNSKLIYNLIIILGVFSILLNWIILGGVPIMYGDEMRFDSIPMLSTIYSLGVIVVLLLLIKTKEKKYYLWTLLYILLAVGQGYRTNVVVIMIILFLYYVGYVNITFRRKNILLVIFVLGFVGINVLKLTRDINLYGEYEYYQKLSREGVPEELIVVSPVIRTISGGPGVFQIIRDNFDSFGFGYGKYMLQNISTVLPGKQKGYGDIYHDMVYEPTENTKTGTILAPLYIEAGVWGIIIGAFLLGFLLRLHMPIKLTTSSILMYLVVISMFLLYIHNGYLFQPSSLIIYFSMILLFFIQKLTINGEKYKDTPC